MRRFGVVTVVFLLLAVLGSAASFADEPVLGQEDAPVTIVEFCDFQGTFCKRLEQDTIPKIVENYVKTGKVKLVWKDFPLSSLHPWTQAPR